MSRCCNQDAFITGEKSLIIKSCSYYVGFKQLYAFQVSLFEPVDVNIEQLVNKVGLLLCLSNQPVLNYNVMFNCTFSSFRDDIYSKVTRHVC